MNFLRFWSSQYVAHLKEENAWLRTQMLHERQRAEDAVSQMLALKTQGAAALPPRPLIADHEKDVAQEIERVFADAEFARSGE